MPHHFYSVFCLQKFKDHPDSPLIYTCSNRITNVARYFPVKRGDYFMCKVTHLSSNAHFKNDRVKCNVCRSDVARISLNWAYFERNSWRKDPFDSKKLHLTLTYSRVCRIPSEFILKFRIQINMAPINQEDNRARGIEMDPVYAGTENEQTIADYIALCRSFNRNVMEPLNDFDSDSSVDFTSDEEVTST